MKISLAFLTHVGGEIQSFAAKNETDLALAGVQTDLNLNNSCNSIPS